MIKLDKITIKETELTANWSCFRLFSIDTHSNQVVCLAGCSFATGSIEKYPKATKESAEKNIKKLQQYLVDNEIKTETDWAKKASDKAKDSFLSCFDMTSTKAPYFSNER